MFSRRERAERRHHTKETDKEKKEGDRRLDMERRKQGQKGRETDEDSTKEDNARATSPTRRKKVKHVANHVTGIRRGVRQSYADWTSVAPTAENWLRTNVPRASLL